MFEGIIRKAGNIIHCGFLPTVYAAPNESNTLENENLSERLYAALVPNETQGLTPEVSSFLCWIQNGLLFGAFTGGLIHSKNQYMDFMESATASQYKSHLDAKADLTGKMIKGAVRGSIVWGYKCLALSTTYGFVVNFLPVFLNNHSWPVYILAGGVTGTFAGHLFSDRLALGFEETKQKGRFTYRQLCLLRGVGYGLLFGLIMAAYSNSTSSRSTIIELKKWEKYWRQRQQNKNVSNNKTD